MDLKFELVKVDVPENTNVIIGQAHFIKVVEDIYEALVNSVPNIRFGLGFCESSGPCLVRHEGNDEELRELAKRKAFEIGAGHCFIIFIKNAYPINVLGKLKEVPEVCSIFCATANPVQIIMAETDQGKAIMGIVDGFKSKGIEEAEEIKKRKEFLRKIGYKL
jgi:adenosine/AMP kinase